MFDNNSSTSTNSQARICICNYSSSSSSSSSSTSTSYAPTYDQRSAHIWDYDIVQLIMKQEIVQCHDIAAAEEICMDFRRTIATYSESDFRVNMFIADTSFPLARHVVGPQNTRTLTLLGWADDTRILNETLCPDHVQQNTPEFMTALFNIGRIWLEAATILPPRHIHDLDATSLQDQDNFSTFRPKCTRYNPPGAPGSYVSRFTSHTSHMKLIIRLRKDASPINTAFLMCAVLLDLMAYISYVISKRFHNSETMIDMSIIRVRVWKELSWAANFVDNTIVPILPLLELITMQVYVQPRVVKPTEHIVDRIPDSDPEETDKCIPIAAYPFISDRNAARLDYNPMSPVPHEPVNTIVERTGKKLRAGIFDGGSPSPDVSRTVHIPYGDIKHSWKKQLKFQKLYQDRSQPQVTSVTDPVLLLTTADDNAPAYDGPDLTPVKFQHMNTFTARQKIIMAAAQYVPAKMILDSGADISGVGEQWKFTDISHMSSMSIQGAFDDSMRPSIKGLLGREKLPAVLVPGMKDDIYALSGLLNSNSAIGAKDKVAIFTKNGAIILTADSCKEAILSAIRDIEKIHTADQVDGIYVLRQDMSVLTS